MRIPLLLLLFATVSHAVPTPRDPHPVVSEAVTQISADSIHAFIARLDAFHTRHTYSDTTSDTAGIGAALRWVEAKASLFDLHDRFSFEYYPWTRNWQGQNITRHVLICRVPGRAEDRARYIVGGHIDSRTVGITDLGRAPGADDNASSCAALLELLRVLPDTLEHDLEVLWFTGEEQGLWGSADYANFLDDRNARVDGVIAMDMISHIATNTGAVDSISCRLYAQGLVSQGGSASISRNWQRWFRWVSERYVDDFTMVIFAATDRPGRGSDHISFSEAGYPALRVIERNEDLAYQHTPNDLTEFTTPTYARKVAMVTFGGLINALQAPTRPARPGSSMAETPVIEIPDSIALPEGGAFFLAIRQLSSNDFDTIFDLGSSRSYTFDWGTTGQIFYCSIARSNASGYVSPFSTELRVDYVLPAGERPALVPAQTTLVASPNPFNDEIRLEIDLAQAGNVRLAIYDLMGRLVTVLANEHRAAGPMTRFWEAHDVATGIYFLRLQAPDISLSEKVLLLK